MMKLKLMNLQRYILKGTRSYKVIPVHGVASNVL